MAATLTNKLNDIKSIKASIKSSIEKKGVTVDGSFEDYPDYIDEIETGGSDEQFAALIDRSISGAVVIPDGVTSIGTNAFKGCRLITSVTVPSGVTSIEPSAFEGCNGLTSVTLPAGLTLIDYNAFYNCNSLTSIDIPSSVTRIDMKAFQYCSALTSVTIRNSSSKLTYSNNTFGNISQNAILYVPEALLSDYQNDASWSGAFSQILPIAGDEPAAMTITSCYVDNGQTETAFEAGAVATITVHFAGTGLTSGLDYANLIQVETQNTVETWTITYDSVNSAAEDGTWVDINYNVVVPNSQSRYEETMTFTFGEFTGTIGICSFKISGYEFNDSSSAYNDYPNNTYAGVNVYFDNGGSVTDFYLNKAAQDDISSGILEVITGNAEQAVDNMGTSIQEVDEWTGRGVLQITYTLTPSDANSITLSLVWSELEAVTHTIIPKVPVTDYSVKGVYYLNGNDTRECSQPNSDVWEMPAGPDMYVVCEKFNEGVNDYSAVYVEFDGIEYNDLQDFIIDRDTYKAIRIATLDNGYGEGEHELRACIQGLDCVYEGTINMVDSGDTLPSDAVEANGVSNHFKDENYNDYYRYVETEVPITPNTIVEAYILLGDQYGNMIFGTKGSDDLHDWRLFSTGGQESQDNPGFYDYKFYFDYGSNEGSNEDYGNRIESANVEVADSRFHVICKNGHLTVENNGDTIIDQEGTAWTVSEDVIVELDNLKVFQTSGINVDSVTLYNMQVYQGDTIVRDFVPVTVNGELKLFDHITKRYFDFMTFQPS